MILVSAGGHKIAIYTLFAIFFIFTKHVEHNEFGRRVAVIIKSIHRDDMIRDRRLTPFVRLARHSSPPGIRTRRASEKQHRMSDAERRSST